MKRRSFLSSVGAASLIRMPLWGRAADVEELEEWGPPALEVARPEHQRVVLSFTPVKGATSYRIRYRSSNGRENTIDGVLVSDYAVQGLENGTQYRFRVAAVGPRGTTPFSNPMSATPTSEMDWATLAEAFSGSNPTRSSCPFWMVHGGETDEELQQFMEVIYRFGFEGVTLHPYDFEGFLEEGNWHRWRVIVDHARKRGLTVWEQDDMNYACGYAGGVIVAKKRELARWEVTMPHRETRPGPGLLSLNISALLPAKQRLVAVSAAGPGNHFEDLTDRVSSGQLGWEIPDGQWEVFIHGAWQPGMDDPKVYPDLVRDKVRGYIDPLSPEATDMYVQLVLEGTCRAVGFEEVGPIWKGFYIDEPGFYSSGVMLGQAGGGFPYTPDFLARFQEAYGYSLRPLLPLLWIERGPQTAQVRHDYMDFVSKEYARLFIAKQTKFAEAHGIQTNGHVIEHLPYQLGGGTGSNFRTLEAYSMGGFDHIFDQWYTPEDDVYWRQPKMASSISHYKQTPLDEAMVEHFAATGWRTGLTEMKVMMDWTTCRGLNRIVPCGLDTQDPPVWEDQPEFWLHGKNPLAPYFHAYQVIANRETMMIRGGRHVSKAIVLDNTESAWVGPAEELWKSNKALSQAHFDYDNISFGVFSDPEQCRIGGNRILLGREDYEFVVLPTAEAVPLRVLQRLLDFYEAGGTVILLGPGIRFAYDPEFKNVELVPNLPFRSTDGRRDDEVKKLVARLWSEQANGRGRAYTTSYKDIADLLYSLDAHDVWIDPNLKLLQYYHRQLSGRDLYFFSNEGETIRTTVHLRKVAGIPEIWDPVTGSIHQAPCYATDSAGVSVRLDLNRYESVFVVLNPSAKPQPHLTATDADEVLRATNGEILLRKHTPGVIHYTLAHVSGVVEEKQLVSPRKPLLPITLGEGWSRAPHGTKGAIYKCSFDWSSEPPVSARLVIEDMTQVIHVKLNGKGLGWRFTYPFWFELGAAVQQDGNELEIEHVERYRFTSRLGKIRVVPYYEFRV